MLHFIPIQRDTEDLAREGFVFNISTLVLVEQRLDNASNSKCCVYNCIRDVHSKEGKASL